MKTKSLSGIFMSLFFTLCISFLSTPVVAEVANISYGAAFAGITAGQVALASAPMFFPYVGSALLFSVPAGTLTCGDLFAVMGKMEQIWVDNRVNAEYMPEAEVVKAILENQTAKIGDITGKQDKNKKIKITWISDCNVEAEDCTTECLPTGPELGIDCQELEPTICKEANFSVNEDTLRAVTYSKEEFIARAMLKRLKVLDEESAAAVVAFLENSEGVSVFDGDQGDIVGSAVGASYIAIDPSLWTADLIGYFKLVAKMNKFGTPYMIHGNNLYISSWKAESEAANADGKGNLNKFNQLKQYWDPFNMEGVFTPDSPSSFLLDKGAVAFGAKWQYDETPTDYGKEGQRWSIASKTLPGVRYDVHYNLDCVNREIIHKFNIISKGGIYLTPKGCTGTDTGIIRFAKETV